jgi:hypothetical protein
LSQATKNRRIVADRAVGERRGTRRRGLKRARDELIATAIARDDGDVNS